MQPLENHIQFRFKLYDNIACLTDGFLYQTEHCPAKRTKLQQKKRRFLY